MITAATADSNKCAHVTTKFNNTLNFFIIFFFFLHLLDPRSPSKQASSQRWEIGVMESSKKWKHTEIRLKCHCYIYGSEQRTFLFGADRFHIFLAMSSDQKLFPYTFIKKELAIFLILFKTIKPAHPKCFTKPFHFIPSSTLTKLYIFIWPGGSKEILLERYILLSTASVLCASEFNTASFLII